MVIPGPAVQKALVFIYCEKKGKKENSVVGSWRGMRFPGRRTLWSFLRGVKTNYSWWSDSKTKWGLRGCKQAAHPVFFSGAFIIIRSFSTAMGTFLNSLSLSSFSVTLGITSFFLFLFFFFFLQRNFLMYFPRPFDHLVLILFSLYNCSCIYRSLSPARS